MEFPSDERVWLMLAIGEYDRLRGRCPELARLQRANFSFSAELSTTLGHWDRDRRMITLSLELAQPRRYSLLCEVIAHETAHQLVSEALHGDDDAPHGEAFRQACALLGTPHDATMRPERLEQETEPGVVRKIRKLLALSSSDNPHEAEAALAKAQLLSTKYNVDLDGAPPPRGYSFRLVGQPWLRVPSSVYQIAQLVCDHYFVSYICRGVDDSAGQLDGKRHQLIELYGRPENLDLAEYVFSFLLEQGERAYQQHRRETGAGGVHAKRSFLNGLYDGFRERLDRERLKLISERALVYKGDPALDSYYRDRNPYVRNIRRSAPLDARSHDAGIDAGRKLELRPAVRGGGDGPAGYLSG